MRKVLVLGASGFIGGHLALSLAGQGHQVIAATRRKIRLPSSSIQTRIGAFDTPEDFVPLLSDSPIIIHAASSTTPGSSAAQPQIEGNLRTTLALLEALQQVQGARLIYLSSGGTLYGPRETPARESDPLRPRSYHGAGKAAAEMFIRAWADQFEGDATILRPSNVYGPGQSPRTGFAVVPTAFQSLRTDQVFTMLGDGTMARDYLHVADLASLVELVAASNERGAGVRVLNAGSGESITLNRLLSLIEETAGKQLRREFKPARRVDVSRIALDCSAAREFGWSPCKSLTDGLKETWEWLRTQ